jgi:GNAT superfamily N-acetyltransferase
MRDVCRALRDTDEMSEHTEYRLLPQPPSALEYLWLRHLAGLRPKSEAQAGGAVTGSWSFCHVRTSTGEAVAMGRVIGDGGWYFHLADVATSPPYQRRGLGLRVARWLLDDIGQRAPDGAYVSLIASVAGGRLFEQLGFSDVVAPAGRGMQLVLPAG